jgi:hypothetical protein
LPAAPVVRASRVSDKPNYQAFSPECQEKRKKILQKPSYSSVFKKYYFMNVRFSTIFPDIFLKKHICGKFIKEIFLYCLFLLKQSAIPRVSACIFSPPSGVNGASETFAPYVQSQATRAGLFIRAEGV